MSLLEALKTALRPSGLLRLGLNFVGLRRHDPEHPDDPFALVGAPKKPRPPHRRSAAVAELPEA